MKKIIIIVTAITIIFLGGGYYWKHTTSPEYSLWQAKKAFEQHDLISFEKYVDIEGISNSLIDQIMIMEREEPKDEWEALGESIGKGFVNLFKPQFSKLIKQQVVELVETGRFEEERDSKISEESGFSLPSIWHKAGGGETGFQGIKYVKKEGKIAYIGLNIFLEEYNANLILDLKMRDRRSYWQAVALINLDEYLKKLDELRLKRGAEEQKRLVEIKRLKAEQAVKKIEAINEDIRKYKRIVSSEYGRDMKEAAWNNLVSRYPEASGLAVGDIKGFGRLYRIHETLRSSYKTLSVSQVQLMPNVSIRGEEDWGFHGHSTFSHDYNLKTIRGDKVVVDNATDLMWHQSGSDKILKWNAVKEWVRSLNSRGYAGYQDWRLPTVDEAVSLLESSKMNGHLYIDPVFSKKHSPIWTGDKFEYEGGSEAAWLVFFGSGFVGWSYVINDINYVRPVRSF